jgi:hypothetical protein
MLKSRFFSIFFACCRILEAKKLADPHPEHFCVRIRIEVHFDVKPWIWIWIWIRFRFETQRGFEKLLSALKFDITVFPVKLNPNYAFVTM